MIFVHLLLRPDGGAVIVATDNGEVFFRQDYESEAEARETLQYVSDSLGLPPMQAPSPEQSRQLAEMLGIELEVRQ